MRQRVPMDKVLLLRQMYDSGQTLTSLGRMFGYTPEWVRQLLRRTPDFVARKPGYNLIEYWAERRAKNAPEN